MTAIFAISASEWLERTEERSDFATVTQLAREAGYNPMDLRGPSREQSMVEGRRVVARRLRDLGWSYPRIGKGLGGRDHSSIWWMLRGGRHKKAQP